MHREEVHEIWAPSGGLWSLWVKPVLFAQMPESPMHPRPGEPPTTLPRPWSVLDVSWAPPAAERIVLVVDLVGLESVHLGLALARRGYRSVPLFNACTAPHEVIPQGSIQRALGDGAADLRAFALPADAPPAFLLDRYRRAPVRPVRPGDFDNRWRIYPEDFPSAETLLARGFSQVIVVQRDSSEPLDDLASVLGDWHEDGLGIALKDLADDRAPQPLVVPRPSWLRRAWQGLLRYFGYERSPKGGFGYVIQEHRHG
jgi:hypothetical protein